MLFTLYILSLTIAKVQLDLHCLQNSCAQIFKSCLSDSPCDQAYACLSRQDGKKSSFISITTDSADNCLDEIQAIDQSEETLLNCGNEHSCFQGDEIEEYQEEIHPSFLESFSQVDSLIPYASIKSFLSRSMKTVTNLTEESLWSILKRPIEYYDKILPGAHHNQIGSVIRKSSIPSFIEEPKHLITQIPDENFYNDFKRDIDREKQAENRHFSQISKHLDKGQNSLLETRNNQRRSLRGIGSDISEAITSQESNPTLITSVSDSTGGLGLGGQSSVKEEELTIPEINAKLESNNDKIQSIISTLSNYNADQQGNMNKISTSISTASSKLNDFMKAQTTAEQQNAQEQADQEANASASAEATSIVNSGNINMDSGPPTFG